MRRLCGLGLVWLALAGEGAGAQSPATSAGPAHVAVTLYRNAGRAYREPLDRSWLGGYALVSETRQVTVPAGESEIRFEGVAGGIVPQSAIVTGFPDGIVERNQDAYLLSPGTLVDRSLGRRVVIRRTSPATGRVRETEAVIRSGANGVVLQTPDGFEALRCTGLAEGLVFASVPPGLSARPTLSVRARARETVTATVTLSYLATGFDWQANYIATLSDDGARIDLFAWLTLASNDETSFVGADAQAVAGRVNSEQARVQPREGGPLALECWPQATTSDIPLRTLRPPPTDVVDNLPQSIVVTGSRVPMPNLESASPVTVINAVQEELGDLKLYRIPEPVTVAANGQKQVALLHQPAVEVRLVYRLRINPAELARLTPARRILVTRNRTAEGLGVPLPAGPLQLFGAAAGRTLLLGQGFIDDHAVGEDVEIELGEAPGVIGRIERPARRDYVLTIANDQAVPMAFEAEFGVEASRRFRPQGRLARRNGRPLWTVTVPANGTATLRYRLGDARPR